MEEKFKNINFYCVLADIARNLWVIVMAAAIACMSVILVNDYVYKPLYKSSVTFVVSSKATTYSSSLNMTTAANMAKVFSEILESDVLKETAAKSMGLSMLPGTTGAQVIEGTNLLVLSATCDTPFEAFRVISAIIDTYPGITSYVYDNAVLDIITNPVVPTAPSNVVNTRGTMKYSAVFCAVAMLVVIVLLSIFRDTVKSPSDVELYLDTRLLATVFHEKKNKTFRATLKNANKALLITNPVVGFAFTETLNRLSVKLELTAVNKGKKVFLVTSVAENEGKSTITGNLALSLAKKGHKVLLIDADLRKPSIYKMFDRKKSKKMDFGQFLGGSMPFDKMIETDEATGLDMLLTRRNYLNSNELVISGRFKTVINELRAQYEFIIIDSSPMSVLMDTETIADCSDEAILIVRQDTAYIPVINDIIDVITRSGAELMGCVFNNVRALPFQRDEQPNSKYGYGEYSRRDSAEQLTEDIRDKKDKGDRAE